MIDLLIIIATVYVLFISGFTIIILHLFVYSKYLAKHIDKFLYKDSL